MSSELPTPNVGGGRQCYIGFCGRVYGFLKYHWKRKDWGTGKVEECEWIAWNIEDTLTPGQKKIKYLLSLEQRRRLEPCFKVVKNDSIFIVENAPIFVITPWERVCCPLFPNKHEQSQQTLQNLGFDKVVEAKDAYNDLINYIDFLGREHKEVPDMDDKVKIRSRGFNDKSFRG
jgi:hypothetical protein